MPLSIRPMLPSDLAALLQVQAACYPPAMQEPCDVVLARLAVAGDCCVVGCDAEGVCGYLFAYPSRLGRVTALGAAFAPAHDADTLYLHDLAVAPRALGQSLARALVEDVTARARRQGMTQSALVSVQDSARFWRALGYRATPNPAPEMATYPQDAVYMVRPLLDAAHLGRAVVAVHAQE